MQKENTKGTFRETRGVKIWGFGRRNHVESASLEILVNFINRLSAMRKKRSKSNAGENKVKLT